MDQGTDRAVSPSYDDGAMINRGGGRCCGVALCNLSALVASSCACTAKMACVLPVSFLCDFLATSTATAASTFSPVQPQNDHTV